MYGLASVTTTHSPLTQPSLLFTPIQTRCATGGGPAQVCRVMRPQGPLFAAVGIMTSYGDIGWGVLSCTLLGAAHTSCSQRGSYPRRAGCDAPPTPPHYLPLITPLVLCSHLLPHLDMSTKKRITMRLCSLPLPVRARAARNEQAL